MEYTQEQNDRIIEIVHLADEGFITAGELIAKIEALLNTKFETQQAPLANLRNVAW